MADGRIDRERNRSLGLALDLRALARPGDGARQLVQVYDGGALPTAGDKVYLTHPAVLTFDESEGAAWSGAIDSSVTLPVVVLGSRAPAAGDYLVAHLAGGRWVAESGGATPSIPCFPCGIPEKNFTFTWGGDFPGSAVLTWNGNTTSAGASWSVSGITFGGYTPTSVTLTCNSGIMHMVIVTSGLSCNVAIQSSSCSPLHLQLTTGSPATGVECPQYSASGVSPMFVDE